MSHPLLGQVESIAVLYALEGLSDREIAGRMGLTESSVAIILDAARIVVGVTSRQELLKAVRTGSLPEDRIEAKTPAVA